ncbi:hypothetical protein NC653_032989 [Populus alba x Populus x berolinensis]|uniref:pyridoxal 5'-phosphate synthase n=1 Tax=Populus alba x Populus x berolinensis TaxID=444605 RepID=A0AAD6LSS9_9ROSI|nr:hypothetical protein NC653_032989 [Populus alba x Populus x berolinensis]
MGTVTQWKQLLLSALESNSHLKHSPYFQFATIGCNGRPSNRTVVFRGFEENSDRIQINTDCRTRKIEELKHCPFAEICWYFSDSWEQFRINGRVDVIDGSNPDPEKLQMSNGNAPFLGMRKGHLMLNVKSRLVIYSQREKSWFASSLKSRLQYLGPNPGLPCLSEQSLNELFLDPSSGPVASFCLLVLDPDQVQLSAILN